MGRQNDGIRVKLSRLSPDRAFDTPPPGEKGFVDYVSDIAVDNPTLKNKFIEKMNTNYDTPYLSDYAKKLSRQAKLEETSSNIYEKMSSLPSFHDRNTPLGQYTLNNDNIDFIIKSYLKRRGGKKSRNRKSRNRKSVTKIKVRY